MCSTCMKNHIHEEIRGKSQIRVICPVDGCSKELTLDDLGRLGASTADMDRLEDNRTRDWLRNQPDFRWEGIAAGGCSSCVARWVQVAERDNTPLSRSKQSIQSTLVDVGRLQHDATWLHSLPTPI